jgi:DNA-binding response OmpR family regulator
MRILSVGQCGVDGPRLRRWLTDEFDAQVDDARTGDDALRQCQGNTYDLVLINRVLASDGASGLDLVEPVKASGAPVLLVSDRPEAQEAAAGAGAAAGFGKSILGTPEARERILAACRGRGD